MQCLLGQGSYTNTAKDDVLTLYQGYRPLQYLEQFQGISMLLLTPHGQLSTIGKSLIFDRFHKHTGTWAKVHYNGQNSNHCLVLGTKDFKFFSSPSSKVIVYTNNKGRNFPVPFFLSFFFFSDKMKMKSTAIFLDFGMLVTERKVHHFPLEKEVGFSPSGIQVYI